MNCHITCQYPLLYRITCCDNIVGEWDRFGLEQQESILCIEGGIINTKALFSQVCPFNGFCIQLYH